MFNLNMNPMMGNMNQMGMNNQLMTNFAMDDTAMKLKAIIEPYEKKITELEQIIKQKDFEILVLNQKLNDFKKNQININNNMNMNMMNPMMMSNNIVNNNMMNPMMANNNLINNNTWRDCYDNMGNNNNMNLFFPNMNNNIINSEPKFKLFIKYKENEYNETFNMDENTGKFFKRFCRKLGIKYKNCKCISNGKAIPPSLTFAESGVVDNSQISIIEVNSNNNFNDNESEDDDECECERDKKNILFKTTSGLIRSIIISTNHSISTLIKKYVARIGMNYESAKKRLCFIFSSQKLKFGDLTKIKDFFRFELIPKITVNDIGNLIGV